MRGRFGLDVSGFAGRLPSARGRKVGTSTRLYPGYFSTDPAMRLIAPPKSGKSMKASNSPATQKMCMCVKSASRPRMATISNCTLWDLCATRSGKV